MPLPVRLLGAAVQLGVQPVHRLAARPDAEKREDGMDQAGEAAADHAHAEPGGMAEMPAVAFADFLGVTGERIAYHLMLASLSGAHSASRPPVPVRPRGWRARFRAMLPAAPSSRP